ncbi:peptidoglycan DD-metalloendopeptidase family protein [Pararhizobium mangrovi]|nr:peptidoglycan DD-metalloendopeptidase family protein [Pararhizobium mangrovi]
MAQPLPANNDDYSSPARTASVAPGAVQRGTLPPPGSANDSRPQTVSSSQARAATGWSTNSAMSVTLRPGEDVDTLSRRYGVPADAIMRANHLSSASAVSAGQQIVIPTYNRGGSDTSSAGTQSASATPSLRPGDGTRTLKAPEAAEQVASTHGGSYTVQSGDTLTRIASRTGVSIDALKQANDLSGTAIRIGQHLTLPSGATAPEKTQQATEEPAPKPQAEPAVKSEAASKPAANEDEPAAKTARSAQSEAPKPGTEAKVEEPAETKVASLPKSSGVGKLRWPARGQIVSRFGSREDGHQNDGIDISVPEGTPVKAAENGVVIYAGDGLKQYGNTVLVRHDDGLVTVYGYAKDIKVKRGAKVTRGEVIADSGMSGAADRPKLHFEVRKDATPVDPTSYLD